MNIALFGGSFNPPHVGHQIAALYVLETRPVDQIWFIPCHEHPFDKALTPFHDRLAMCELMARALGPRAKVDPIESTLGGKSRTWNTVEALSAAHPDRRWSLIVGSDLAAETETWYRAADLKARVPFIVVPRAGGPRPVGAVAPEAGGFAIPRVSSTEVRDRIARGESAADLVPRSVLEFIVARGLYGARTVHDT